MLAESGSIIDSAFKYEIKKDKPDLVLISGDLTKTVRNWTQKIWQRNCRRLKK